MGTGEEKKKLLFTNNMTGEGQRKTICKLLESVQDSL